MSLLEIEIKNIDDALAETLRHDYGVERSRDFYQECTERLNRIKAGRNVTNVGDRRRIFEHISQLNGLARFICFMERSHLGDFSWPFANVLTRMAKTILVDDGLVPNQPPIFSVISEGFEYKINYEFSFAKLYTGRQFVFVIFPRSLKHNVLFHVLFGHELAHAALGKGEAGDAIAQFIAFISNVGPLCNSTSLNAWLRDPNAPPEIKSFIEDFEIEYSRKFEIDDDDLKSWHVEIMCDVFGLLLFGPCFIAAHRVCISYREAERYQCSKTHPPYEVRHAVLQSAMEILGWDVPILKPLANDFARAEGDFLDFLMKPSYSPWNHIVDRVSLQQGIQSLQNYMLMRDNIAFQIPSIEFVEIVLKRLEKRIPPIFEIVKDDDNTYQKSHVGQTLYCGWAYWLGRANLNHENISFGDVNKLCEYALLQQEAINLF